MNIGITKLGSILPCVAGILMVSSMSVFAQSSVKIVDENKLSDNDIQRLAEELERRKDEKTQEEEMLAEEEQKRLEEEQRKREAYQKLLNERVDQVKMLHDKAEKAWEEKKWRSARNYYSLISKSSATGSAEFVTNARSRMLELEKASVELLKGAEDAIDERKYADALKKLKEILKEYPYTESAVKSKRHLTRLRNEPSAMGHVMMADAELAEIDGDPVTAANLYEKILNNKRHQKSMLSRRAKRKLNMLLADDVIRAEIEKSRGKQNNKKAEQLLKSAENYIRNGMTAKGREKLNAVISKYPNTAAAEKAQKKLEGM